MAQGSCGYFRLLDENGNVVTEGTSMDISREYGCNKYTISSLYCTTKKFNGMTIEKVESVVVFGKNARVYDMYERNGHSYVGTGTLRELGMICGMDERTLGRYVKKNDWIYIFDEVGNSSEFRTLDKNDMKKVFDKYKIPKQKRMPEHGVKIRTSSAVQFY